MKVDTTIAIDGTKYSAQLATIASTRLGGGERDIFTARLICHWFGGGISVGECVLDQPMRNPDGSFDRRVGTAPGMDYIMSMLSVTGAKNWEDIPGTRIWVLFPHGKSHLGQVAVGIASTDSDEHMVFDHFWSGHGVDEDTRS